MEGPHWFLMVFPGSTTQGQVDHKTWNKSHQERTNVESSGGHDDYDATADWSEYWSERSSDIWTSSPANKLVCLEKQCNGIFSALCIFYHRLV